MLAVRTATLLSLVLVLAGASRPVAAQLLVDGDFNASSDSGALRSNSAGQDWYESRQDDPSLLTLDRGVVGANDSAKAKLAASTNNRSAYLTQEFRSAQTQALSAQWRIYVDSIANHPTNPDRAGWMLIGDNTGADASRVGPNAEDSERFVYMGFYKSGGGTTGTMSLIARDRDDAWDAFTTVATGLNLRQWYTIKVDLDLGRDRYDIYVDGQYKATVTSRTAKSSVTHISFAQWGDGPGTFYVDNVTAESTSPPGGADEVVVVDQTWMNSGVAGCKQLIENLGQWSQCWTVGEEERYALGYTAAAEVPADARVTGVVYSVEIEEPAVDVHPAPATFWCSDYEIGISSAAGGTGNYVLVWDNAGGQTDQGMDDDAENDRDIKLVSRTTHAFDGQLVNQRWCFRIKDTTAHGGVDSRGGCFTRLRIVIQYGESVSCPSATAQAATGIQCSSATLNGRIADDGGQACQYKFRCTEAGGASYTETSWTGSKRTGESFSHTMSDLKSGVRYTFAAKARNAQCESSWSNELSFTTISLQVETRAATAITCSSATLNGRVVDGGGAACQYKFRYKKEGSTTYTETAWTGSATTGQAFSQAITGLSPTSKYTFAAKIKNSACESPWGTELNFMTVSSQVETRAATAVTCSSATLNGRVVADGGAACQYRFRYKKQGSSTYVNTAWTGSKRTNETFSQAITGLEPWTRYYFAAQIKNSGCESAWGSELNFLTSLSVETQAATNITCASATLNGRIVDDGGAACQYKFHYRKEGSTAYSETSWTGSKRTGESFSQAITGLSQGAKYYFAAKARNGACETPWGTELTFTTMKLPAVTAQAATALGLYSATLNGRLTDDGGGVCQYRFRYRKQGAATYTQTEWTGSKRTGATFSQPISGLSQGTKYFFAAQAKNAECGEGTWSNELSFSTLALTKPQVATRPATNVHERTFTAVGAMVKDGNDVCQYRFRIRRPTTLLTPGRFPLRRVPRITAMGETEMIVKDRITYTSWTGARRTGESFTEEISALDPNTAYYVAAQARNTAGEGALGEEVKVTTPAIAVIKDLWSRHSSMSKHVHFLDGVSLSPLMPLEEFTVQIDWAGLEPGKVQWRTPRRTYDDACGPHQTEVSHSFDVSTEFGVGGKLQVRAVPKAAGKESAWITANFTVTAPPPGVPIGLFLAIEDGPVNGTAPLWYATKAPFWMELFSQTTPGDQIPERFVGYGTRDCGLHASVHVVLVVVREGNAQFTFAPPPSLMDLWRWFSNPVGPPPHENGINSTLAGAGSYGPAAMDISIAFTNGKWEVKGVLTVSMHQEMDFPIGQWLIVEARGWVSVDLENQIVVTGWGPELSPEWSGSVSLKSGLGIAAGIGIAGLLGCDVYGEGGLEMVLEFPGSDPLTELCLYFEGGFECYFLWWETDWEPIVEEEWCFVGQPSIQSLHVTATSCGLGPLLPGTGCPALGCLGKDPSRFRLMDRNYIRTDYAVWLPEASQDDVRSAGELTALAMSAEPADIGEELVLQSNVFKMSVPAIASDDDELLLAWVYDDPSRSSINRTQIVFSRSDQGTWTPPSPIHDDGTADFSPQLAVLPNGRILCAWENVNRVLSDGENLTAAASAIDIAAASYDGVSGLWSTQALTNDSRMDRSPHIVPGDNDTAMIVWVSNEKNDAMGRDPSALNTIQYSLWDGHAWSKPGAVAANIGYMLKTSSLAYDGTEAVYVYAIDADWNIATSEDQELYALVYDGSRWSQPIRLTNDAVADANPQVVHDQGEPLLVWYRDGSLVSCRSLFTSNLEQIISANGIGGTEFRLAKSSNGRISLVWTDVSPKVHGTDVFTATYDPKFDLWSAAYPLTSDKAMEKAIAVTYVGDEELVLAYNKVEMKINDQGIPEPNQTDLCVLRHGFGRDLAVAATDIAFDPANPKPGSTVEITAVIHNLGDTAEANVSVTFYHGDPNEAGVQIGDPQTILGPIPAGGSGSAVISWTIPNVDSPQRVYVTTSVADDPAAGLPERNLANNVARVALMAPDLAVRSLFVEATGYKARSITAKIANAGVVAARSTEVAIRRDSARGPVLKSFTIAALDAGGVEELHFDWDISAEDFDDPEALVYVVVDGSDSIAESDENNNTSLCVVHVSMKGDVTDDGSVDETDLAVLAERWLDTSESTDWLPGCDLDHSGRIDTADFSILGTNWRREAAWHAE